MTTKSAEIKPVAVPIIAVVLLGSCLSGSILLLLGVGDPSIFPPLPVLTDGVSAAIAYWCVLLMCASFLIAGGTLLFYRKVALPFFLFGLILYAGYIISAFLIVLIEQVWWSITHTAYSGESSAMVLSTFLTGAGSIALVIGGGGFYYLATLARRGILR